MAASQAHLELWVCYISSVEILTIMLLPCSFLLRNSEDILQLLGRLTKLITAFKACNQCFICIARTGPNSAPEAWLSEYIANVDVIKCSTCSISILLILHSVVACVFSSGVPVNNAWLWCCHCHICILDYRKYKKNSLQPRVQTDAIEPNHLWQQWSDAHTNTDSCAWFSTYIPFKLGGLRKAYSKLNTDSVSRLVHNPWYTVCPANRWQRQKATCKKQK